MTATKRRVMIQVTEWRNTTAGAGKERNIEEVVGIPVSRITKVRPITVVDWAGARDEKGAYPNLQLTEIKLGKDDFLFAKETVAEITNMINGDV